MATYGPIEGRVGKNTGEGPWMWTHGKRKVFPTTLTPDDIDIGCIAHSLSLQCRFAGHCRWHYSVAQHSLLVAENVPHEHALWALLHDASEAYLTDIIRPVKMLPLFAPYRAIEDEAMAVICSRFGLDPTEPECVRDADRLLLVTEARDLMSPLHPDWEYQEANGYASLRAPIVERHPRDVERDFLHAFDRYSTHPDYTRSYR